MDYWFFLKEEAFRSLLEKKERKKRAVCSDRWCPHVCDKLRGDYSFLDCWLKFVAVCLTNLGQGFLRFRQGHVCYFCIWF